jgi:hypothetical protein
MISQKELPGYIAENIPELSQLCKTEKGNVYNIVRHLFNYTKSHVVKHNMDAAKHCMRLAEQLYHKGNQAVKNAVENVFVYSFTHGFFYDRRQEQQLKEIIPLSLYEIYNRQLMAHL